MELSKLPVEGGVRQRGEQVTRLETFVDAAFAFAMTLLVVSFEAMPDSFAELYDALRRLPAFLALARRWLKPGGQVAFIDSLDDPQSGTVDRVVPVDGVSVRKLADGREFRVVKVYHEPGALTQALGAAGFEAVSVTTTGRFFMCATGRAG